MEILGIKLKYVIIILSVREAAKLPSSYFANEVSTLLMVVSTVATTDEQRSVP